VSPWWKAPSPALIEPGRARLGGAAREAGEGWRGALEALEALVAEKRPGRLRLVISNHFVRFLVVPEDRTVASAAERAAYLAHHFGAVYGERAARWAIAAEPRGGGSLLAAAVDSELLAQARALAARHGAVLSRAEPLAVAAFNRARRRSGEGARFFAVLEPGRACVLLADETGVRRVANQRCADPRAELAALVALESAGAGFGAGTHPRLEIAEPLAA
jgi:hypothetical protein